MSCCCCCCNICWDLFLISNERMNTRVRVAVFEIEREMVTRIESGRDEEIEGVVLYWCVGQLN